MSESLAVVNAIPTGGAAMLSMPGYAQPPSNITSITISRSADGGVTWTQIYQGAPTPSYLDIGDGSPAPLVPTTTYQWQVTDEGGTVTIGPITPAGNIVSTPDVLTQILLRLLQGAFNSLALPAGIRSIQLTAKMPTGGWQAAPFCVVNLDLIQQSEVMIGEDVQGLILTDTNNWTIWVNARRIWRISVFSQIAEERDYYRDTLITIFRVLKATAFSPLGYNVSHSFQAASGTDAKSWEGMTLGFYHADILMEINGVFSSAVLLNYGIIEQIDVNPTLGPPGEAP